MQGENGELTAAMLKGKPGVRDIGANHGFCAAGVADHREFEFAPSSEVGDGMGVSWVSRVGEAVALALVGVVGVEAGLVEGVSPPRHRRLSV